MTQKFQNKYRIPSARLQNWDYGCNAAYFVTICTQHRQHYLGDIMAGQIRLSEIGKIVNTEWLKTFEMRPDMNLFMGEYIIMPNHFHAIIIIGQNKYNTKRGTADGMARRDAMHCVSTNPTNAPTINPTNAPTINPTNAPTINPTNAPTINPTNAPTINPTNAPTNPTNPKNKFGPQTKNLASIIRGFKIGVTTNARKTHPEFAWQPRYHDHIIRNHESFQRITAYIRNNPENWNKDKFYSG